MRKVLVLLAVLACAAPAAAQKPAAVPPRPDLGAVADTNDALGYFMRGVNTLSSDPRQAAAAFYWASRIDPSFAEAFYGQRVALLMSDDHRLADYLEGARRARRSPEIRHADSLYDRALMSDPFFYRRFDRQMLMRYWEKLFEDEVRREGGNVNKAEISHWLETWLMTGPPYMRAWRAYGDGNLADAVDHYARAVHDAHKDRWSVRAERARTLYLLGRYDEALTEMTQAIQEWRKSDDSDDLVFLYQSKALLEHSVALLHEKKGDLAQAREAYGRALQEDLSFYPAHLRLSTLALAAGDTTTALGEMDLAVQIRGDDGALRYQYGYLLAAARRYPEAEEQLKKATELEPFYAAPHFVLARLYDGSRMNEEALASYRAFAERASRRDARLGPVKQRIAQLEAEAAAPADASAKTPAGGPR